MGGLQRVARVFAAAGLAVTAGVAGGQVYTDGKLDWGWAYVALAVTVLAAVYSEVLVPGGYAREGSRQGRARGGRRVYLRQLRASVRDMETVGIATQGEFVLRMRQVYVDVSLAPKPPQGTARERYVGRGGRLTAGTAG